MPIGKVVWTVLLALAIGASVKSEILGGLGFDRFETAAGMLRPYLFASRGVPIATTHTRLARPCVSARRLSRGREPNINALRYSTPASRRLKGMIPRVRFRLAAIVGGIAKSVPFTMIRTKQGDWLVNQIDLNAAGVPGRACNSVPGT